METNMGDLGLGWEAYQGITSAMIPPLHTYSLVLVHGASTFCLRLVRGGKERSGIHTYMQGHDWRELDEQSIHGWTTRCIHIAFTIIHGVLI